MNKEEMFEFACHNDALQAFNDDLYDNIFSESDITSGKKALKIKEPQDGINGKFYGFFLEKGKDKYFCVDAYAEKLPFKVLKYVETDYRGDVFRAIDDIKPITIPAKKKMSFRELVKSLGAFKHSRPKHWLLYKIAFLAAHVDRINFRVSTDQGFGKDSVIGIVQQLRPGTTANIYGATFAKLEYSLTHNLICLNEMGNLKPEEKYNMQQFLLATGAYSNTYTKRTRKTASTQEQYDISKLSLVILYNLPSYYTTRAQDYFDQMFTPAVNARFIPFVFEGQLTSNFEKVQDPVSIMEHNKSLYQDLIATVEYFKHNNLTETKYTINEEFCAFTEQQKRYERSFRTILKWVAEYAESQEEFDSLTEELYRCYKHYEQLIAEDQGEEYETTDIK